MTLKQTYFIVVLPCLMMAQQYSDIVWKPYVFYIPENSSIQKTYTEISFSINHSRLTKYKMNNRQFIVAIKGNIQIFQDSAQLIRSDTFIVKSPSADDSSKIPDFTYLKRYRLPDNHHYFIHLEIRDFFKPSFILLKDKKIIETKFDSQSITLSDILFIDTLEKSDNKKDMFYRYGYSIIPYNNDYFNEYFQQINFLCEIYNTDTVLGTNEPFIVQYYIQDKDTKKKLEQFGGFKKMKASRINILLGTIGIKDLPSGNYCLIVEVKNKDNRILSSKTACFQRKNHKTIFLSKTDDQLFFGNQNNPDTLKMWTEALWPIANNLEKDWIINQSITKDATMMKNFMIDFWNKRAADTASPAELARKYYSKLNYVMKNFKCGKISPYYTDRGRVYLQYGEPNQRTIQLSEPGAYPYEIWQYYRIYDAATGQFFSNRRFVFVNKSIADECYTLIHSDMKGEYNNPNWQREIIKHEIYNPNDPYQQQKLNYGNNFDKLYQNPQ